MKKIVCDLCEGTQFVKEAGFFVCQGCGTKYSLEEAKSMMHEVEDGGSAPATAVPTMSVPFVNPNQQQIDNLLILATTAYEAQNYQEAENYCNRAIETDATAYKAWILKGRAVGWSSKIDNLRIEEAAHSYCKAIDFAPEEEKENVKNETSEDLKKLGIALISLRAQRFTNNPCKEEADGFKNDKQTLFNALLILLMHGNVVGIPEGYNEEIAKLISDASEAGYRRIKQAYDGLPHPTTNDLQDAGDRLNLCVDLMQMAIDSSELDAEDDIHRYDIMIEILEYKIGMTSYGNGGYNDYSRTWSLNDVAKRAHRDVINTFREKKTEARKAAEEQKKKEAEERKQRIEAYWAAHQEEKNRLDSEKAELEKKLIRLQQEHSALCDTIDKREKELKTPVPAEAESDKLREQVRELNRRRANLGMFSGKEKNRITDEIAALEGRISSLKEKIPTEKEERKKSIESKLAPETKRKDELAAQIAETTKKISAIDTELTKDPENS